MKKIIPTASPAAQLPAARSLLCWATIIKLQGRLLPALSPWAGPADAAVQPPLPSALTDSPGPQVRPSSYLVTRPDFAAVPSVRARPILTGCSAPHAWPPYK